MDANQIIEKVKDILTKYREQVKFAFLFGSYATGEADKWSDIDVGIYFSKEVTDELKNKIRFEIMNQLEPFNVDIGYLDNEDIPPIIFVLATEGIPIVINDEDTFYEERMRKIHLLEEMRLIGIEK